MVAAYMVVVGTVVVHIVAVDTAAADIVFAHIAVLDTVAIFGAIAGSGKHVLPGGQDGLGLHERQYPVLAGLPLDKDW